MKKEAKEMAKQLDRFFECNSEIEARSRLRAEIDNWTWLDKETKDRIVAEANLKRTDTKFGPIYQVMFFGR